MRKQRRARIWIEIICVVLILTVIGAITIPRFLRAQRAAQVKRLQEVVDAVAYAIAQEDHRMGELFVRGQILSGSRDEYVGTGTGVSTRVHALSELQSIFTNHTIPDTSLNPLICISLAKENDRLLCFAVSVNCYDRTEYLSTGVHPVEYKYRMYHGKHQVPFKFLEINQDKHYQFQGDSLYFYDPSNGLFSEGVLYQDNIGVGWCVPADLNQSTGQDINSKFDPSIKPGANEN